MPGAPPRLSSQFHSRFPAVLARSAATLSPLPSETYGQAPSGLARYVRGRGRGRATSFPFRSPAEKDAGRTIALPGSAWRTDIKIAKCMGWGCDGEYGTCAAAACAARRGRTRGIAELRRGGVVPFRGVAPFGSVAPFGRGPGTRRLSLGERPVCPRFPPVSPVSPVSGAVAFPDGCGPGVCLGASSPYQLVISRFVIGIIIVFRRMGGGHLRCGRLRCAPGRTHAGGQSFCEAATKTWAARTQSLTARCSSVMSRPPILDRSLSL